MRSPELGTARESAREAWRQVAALRGELERERARGAALETLLLRLAARERQNADELTTTIVRLAREAQHRRHAEALRAADVPT